MQKYIECNQAKGEYINLNRLFGYNWARIFLIIGARGYGKTYRIKLKLVKNFKYKHEKFVIMRDTVASCDEIVQQNGQKLLGDIFKRDIFKNDNFDVKGYTIKINDINCGEVIPMSTYYKYKGNFYNATAGLFDEFIPESVQAYNGNRARQFVNMVETICRDNPNFKWYLTANALDLGNDILELLGFNIKNNKFGLYINEEKKAVLYYAPNSEAFEKRRKNSLAGLLSQNTFLDANINKNAFDSANIPIFEKREPCDLFAIYHNSDNEAVRIFKIKNKDAFYCCRDRNKTSCEYMRYVFNIDQVTEKNRLAGPKIRDWLKSLLAQQKIMFDSKYSFNIFCTIVNNVKKI